MAWLGRSSTASVARSVNATREGQEDQLGALGLVVNVLVLWNTLYMGRGLGPSAADGRGGEARGHGAAFTAGPRAHQCPGTILIRAGRWHRSG